MTSLRTSLRPAVVGLLKCGFKLAGWKLWLAIHIFDLLWSIFAQPFIRRVVLEQKISRKKEALKKFYKIVPNIESKEQFLKEVRDMWKRRNSLQ